MVISNSDQDPDCFECKYNDAWMDHLPDCHYCGIGCDGCSGPGEEQEDDESEEDGEPGIEKKCETCGHKWWISKNPEKETKEPDTCFECKYNDAWMDHLVCQYCGNGCDGCSGPEEEMEDDDYYYQYQFQSKSIIKNLEAKKA